MYRKSFALLTVVGLSSAMAFGQAAVDTLKSRLVNQSVTVKIEGLRISRGVLFKSVDVRILDGVIQKRMFSTNAATDEVLNPGDKVRITKVEAASDKKNDFLRITIAAADGPTVPVAFVFPKGALATQDESQLEQVVGTTFDLSAAGSPAMPAIAPPPPPPDAGTTSNAAPSGWRIQASKDGNEAAIAGVSRVNGRQASAVMALTCTGAEIRVRRIGLPDAEPLKCIGDMDRGNDVVKFSVGERPLEAGSICVAYEDDPKIPVLKLPVDLGAGGLDEVVSSPGSPMVIHIAFSDKPSDEFVAQFQLPQDASPIDFLHSCNKAAAPDAQATTDACPVLPGKGLRKAEVLTALGKPYKGPPTDNDIGVEWAIPKATKAHPVRPKLTLACYYGVGLKPGDPNEPLEKKLIPISSKATDCSARGDTALGDLSATCTGN